MQTPQRFLTTEHRRQRLALWALAMLSWIAAVLFGGRDVGVRQLRQRFERVSLERLTRLTINLLLIRARELAPVRQGKPSYWRHGRHLVARHFIRSLIGARLRRELKHKDVATRVANLIVTLRNLDAAARQLAARMKRRLTRLLAIKPARMRADAPISLATPAPALADSS